MRKLFSLVVLIACLFGILNAALAQDAKTEVAKEESPKNDSLPYLKYPTLPAFNIRLTDSFTIFNTYNIPKGRPTILILFSPDCKHCKLLTKRLLEGMDSLKNADFYMVTPVHSNTEIKKFYEEHHLADYKNIKVVGRDYEFFFHDFYHTRIVPDVALYDERKKFVKLFEGNTSVEELYKHLHPEKRH